MKHGNLNADMKLVTLLREYHNNTAKEIKSRTIFVLILAHIIYPIKF